VRKILTAEDPIEYEIDGVNQTQIKPSINLTFAAALRSFLRHDPDVIMVGEMRDGETASIAINAALTGHLVLTTLHTNSAAGAVPRLLDMGIDAFLLASSLRCVVGQRLVRVLCRHCKAPPEGAGQNGTMNGVANGASNGHHHNGASHADHHDQHHHIMLNGGKEEFWRAVGCDRCFGTGYSDRLVISEVLDVDDEIRSMIKPGTATGELAKIARQRGMVSMLDDGLKKCREGMTTPDEVRRVALDV
jgi:general secretion pathway protein E